MTNKTVFAVVLTLALLLGACTVYVEPDTGGGSPSLSSPNIITQFAPDRGAGSDYLVGDDVYFRFRANQSGYLTLVSIDPDGRLNVLARNIFVEGRTTYTIPNPNGATTFSLVPPRGQQRVRAIFTAQPTDTTVTYRNRQAGSVNEIIVSDVQTSGSATRDVEQTFFFIR